MAHPDAELKVGTKREAAGFEWTLFKNQFGYAWRAGPRAINIRVYTHEGKKTSVNTSGYRIGDASNTISSFEKAAQMSVDLRRKQYVEARKLVEDFDDWDLVDKEA